MDDWGDALEGYRRALLAAGKSPRTYTTRATWLRLLRDACGLAVGDVTEAVIIDWMAAHPWQPSTRCGVRQAMRGFFAWATDADHCAADPARRLPPVRVPATTPRPVDEDTYRDALTRCDGLARLALLLGGQAGLRRMEMVTLRRDDLDAAGLWVTGKGGKRRVVPVTPQLRAAIETRPPGYLFPARFGDGHMHIDAFGKMVRRCFDGRVGPHRLRHRFATRAYAGTHDLRAVQVVLGHASPRTTAVYVAVGDEALAACVKAAAA